MTELDEAMQQQMAYFVFVEHTNFCRGNFLRFEWEGKEYKPNYRTINNKFSEFSKKGIIEIDVKGNPSYYSLKGHKFGRKPMTLNHMGGITLSPNHPLYKMLQNIVWDKEGIHNIRLRLEVPDIYDIVSIRYRFTINPVSKDIEVPYPNKDNVQLVLRIHKTDTVSVAVSCTKQPITLDYCDNGIPRFFTILARCEGYLQCLTIDKLISIPHFKNWLITMWHFNRDGLKEYAGEKFSISVEGADNTIERIYSKDFNGKIKPRYEIQEYPEQTIKKAINDKLRIPDVLKLNK